MSFRQIFTFIVLELFISGQAFSQEPPNAIEQLIESLAENSTEELDYSEITEHLVFLQKHPLDINTVSREQMEELIFLTNSQITAILEHRTRIGRFADILELQSLDPFDLESVRWAQIFLKVDNNKIAEPGIFRDGNHELLLRIGQRIGSSESPDNYLGSPLRLMTRYKLVYSKTLSIRLNFEKDAGEEMRIKGLRTFDFASGSIYYQGRGILLKAVAGDYSLQFGQGVGLWSGLGFGKGAGFVSLAKPEAGVKPYSSLNESSFFRGAAASLLIDRVLITPFISLRKLDANVNTDGAVSIISESGLHRTPTELENKSSTAQFVIGTNFQYQINKLKTGATVYQTSFNRLFKSGTSPYKKYDFEGFRLFNASTDFKYNLAGAYFFGEAAHSAGSGYGFLAGAMKSLSHHFSLMVLYRKYDSDYHSFFSNSMSEGSKTSNENGWYAGFDYKLSPKWTLMGYFDTFRFPWLKYRVDAPSSGYEAFAQITYSEGKAFKVSGRYKLQHKQENSEDPGPVSFLDPVIRQNFRVEFYYKLNSKISVRQRNEAVLYLKGGGPAEFGYLNYLDLLYYPLGSHITGNFRIAYSNIPGFNTRIYSYQNDVLYAYSVPAYQGSGLNFYTNVRLTVLKGFDLWGRYACSYIFRSSPDADQARRNKIDKQDFKIQARFQF